MGLALAASTGLTQASTVNPAAFPRSSDGEAGTLMLLPLPSNLKLGQLRQRQTAFVKIPF